MGDLCEKVLLIEIMGRHSNIMLKDDKGMILDSIKHVSSQMSSVREVFPGKEYTYPPSKDKISIIELPEIDEFKAVLSKPLEIKQAIYDTFTGISPLMADELCFLTKIDPTSVSNTLSEDAFESLYAAFNQLCTKVTNNDYAPEIIVDPNGDFKEFYVFHLSMFDAVGTLPFDSISQLLDAYYEKRANTSRVNQKSVDVRKLIQNNVDRCTKKFELQARQMEDTKDLDIFKMKGELIHANLYQIHEGDLSIEVYNYYTDTMETIVLDPNLTPNQNAQRFFSKYNKKKRTFSALLEQIEGTKNELQHLESIRYSLDVASSENDLTQIRNELIASGYLKSRKMKGKKVLIKSEPLHYISSDGFDIYVGKNNFQNDELSLKFAASNDWWFHTKDIPGSHVIVKTNGKEMTDQTFEEAAALAAFYSKAKDSLKVTVDYTQKKNLKKPSGSVPGFVIYLTNFSLVVKPSEMGLSKI